jgi:hypothetical protein
VQRSGIVKYRSGTRWPDDREVGWCCVWSALCTTRWGAWVSWFSLKTKVDGFSRFSLKTSGYGSCGLASKSLTRVSRFGPQNRQLRFGDLAHKIIVTVSLFGPQNQVGGGLLVCTLKPMNGWRRCEDTCWHPVACFVAKRVRLGFPSFASKLANERRRVVHVSSSQRRRRSEAKRWSIRWCRVRRSGSWTKLPFVSYNFPFTPQGHSSLLVFAINRTPRVAGEISIQPSLFHSLAIVIFWEVWVCFMM